MNDIYETPSSELTDAPASGEYGSVERAIAGDYEFDIGNTISAAWAKTNGAKTPLLLASILYVVVYVAATFASEFILAAIGLSMSDADAGGMLFVGVIIQQILLLAVSMPPAIGIFIMGLRRAHDAPITPSSIFTHYAKVVPMVITVLLMYLLLIVGFLLLIIPGIYLAVAYYMALPLVVEKNMGPWEALETSRKAVSKRWFAMLGFMIVLTLINMVAAIPLGIGLLWTVPLSIIAFAMVYRNMFGTEAETLS